MKSKMSFYNTGLGKNLLKRFWPLWLLYFLMLMVELPFDIAGSGFEKWSYPIGINEHILKSGVNTALLSAFACVIVVMAMFSHLYSARSCGLAASLPVRRETVFATACLTGLVPMLLADAACFGVTALLYAGSEYVKLSSLGTWLAAAVLANVAFYGMAVFCAMLTGSIVVLPLVYAVLNVAAFAVEAVATELLGLFLYGFASRSPALLPLSPFVQLYNALRVTPVYTTEAGAAAQAAREYQLGGMNWLGIYCAAGIVLMLAAGLIYRRRRMETAGDTVAVQVLKPIFKYCMSLGTGVVLACFVCDGLVSSLHGRAVAALAIAMLIVGAFVGYIIAEMIVQKTLDVFRGIWKGPAICAAILAVVGLLCEFDVTGYETRVPEADEVRSILCPMTRENIKERETIEDFLEMHRHIIAGKARNEKGFESSTGLYVTYELNDGSYLNRSYEIENTVAAAEDKDSDIARWEAILNSDEVRDYRASFDFPFTRETLAECTISSYTVDSEGRREYAYVTLTPEQALELYNECIVPDEKDGKLCDYFAVSTDKYYDTKTNTTIDITLFDKDWVNPSGLGRGRSSAVSFIVQVNSERCLAWIKENTDIEPQALRIVDPPTWEEGYATDTRVFNTILQ